jgi:phosphohistidine phosphatase SixA
MAFVVALVRHASAGERIDWSAAENRRPLDRRGEKQAAALPATLAELTLSRVLSSPAMRCVQTVEPLARVHSLAVETDQRLGEGNARASLELVLALGQETAVCSHGDNIPFVLSYLQDEGVELGPYPDCKKASTWILTASRPGRFETARYLAPPA